jgi:hypothetical protein
MTNVPDYKGVDAIKDANAEAGRDPYDSEGVLDAIYFGWIAPEYDE